MYQPNYGFQYPYYGAQQPMQDNLAQLRMNASQMQNAAMQPPMPTQTMQAQPAQQSNQIIWVSGEAGAKSYLVAPGNTVMLMDSESERFYIKSADASGMPLPLRVFAYQELTQQGAQAPVVAEQPNPNNFITREEFERRIASLTAQREDANNG